MAESFFSTLEAELLKRRRFTSQAEAKMPASATSRAGTTLSAFILPWPTGHRSPTKPTRQRRRPQARNRPPNRVNPNPP